MNKVKSSQCGQKRSLSEEIQSISNESELQRQYQNEKVDAEDDGKMFQMFETGKTSRGNLCLWHEGF
jgi:hypothetical protein